MFDNKPLDRDAIFWEHEGNVAVRVSDWKLVRLGGQGQWELYDLKTDRTEQKNLARQEPERLRELARKWTQWASRGNVAPDGLPIRKKLKK